MPFVLVTGASCGIDCQRARRRYWTVVAGVRLGKDAAPIKAADPLRMSSLMLDVTDAEQVAALDDSLPERLDAVANNAGILIGRPMETLSPSELRRQFEVNVIGHLA
jgi:NAD(P)-dependent dehydrogenase (short-subunit alcohol dehydrogenase family)